jgi:fumarate reductase subunit C
MHHTDRDFVMLLIIVYTVTLIVLSLCFRHPPEQYKTIMCFIATGLVVGIPLLSYLVSFFWERSIYI